ncbi:MAG: hypothetical protein FJX53_08010 [Alphaproteobacteria bacterium]|nr:hypothetical protein [Alphaproteobacteria bacterium]
MIFLTASSAMPLIKAARIMVFGVTAPKRVAELPSVPTMVKAGYSGFGGGSWRGLFVPAGTPKEVADRLYAAAIEAMKTREVVERLGNGRVEAITSASPPAFAQYVAQQVQHRRRAAKEAGATVD